MIGKDRAKLSRTRAKVNSGQPLSDDDRAFLARIGVEPHSLLNPVQSGANATGTGQGTEPNGSVAATSQPDVWDRVIDVGGTDTESDDETDEDDESEPIAEPVPPGPSGAPGNVPPSQPSNVIPFKPRDPKQGGTDMSVDLSRGTVSGFLLLTQYGWDIFGDKDLRDTEPNEKELAIMGEIVSRYAAKYGWTKELDDALLFTTVLVCYQVRCARAPTRKQKKGEKK